MDKKSQKSYLPLINRGVWSRVYGFENNILNIIEYLKDIEYEDEINFIDLGSGFNTLFFNLEDKFQNLKYVEIDYEDNTNRKVK
jgi:tRNA wybutosine-synthesizing protein 4